MPPSKIEEDESKPTIICQIEEKTPKHSPKIEKDDTNPTCQIEDDPTPKREKKIRSPLRALKSPFKIFQDLTGRSSGSTPPKLETIEEELIQLDDKKQTGNEYSYQFF